MFVCVCERASTSVCVCVSNFSFYCPTVFIFAALNFNSFIFIHCEWTRIVHVLILFVCVRWCFASSSSMYFCHCALISSKFRHAHPATIAMHSYRAEMNFYQMVFACWIYWKLPIQSRCGINQSKIENYSLIICSVFRWKAENELIRHLRFAVWTV